MTMRNHWFMPLFCVFVGALIFGAFALGDGLVEGLISFAIMAAFGAALVLLRRNETVRGLSGPGRDERWELIDLRATALSGGVLSVVVIGAWLYEIASGRSGSPYTQLGAVAGMSYIAAVALLRRRS